jgi:NADH dehydrogenase FAD-containing subunit
LDGIVRKRCEELGVQLVTGQRVVMPEQGFPTDGTPTEVQLTDRRKIPADLVILATGQIPNTQLLQTLDSTTTDPSTSIINPSNGFLRVRPTLQLLNPQYPHIFALGDVADTGAPKAARPGMMQADVVVQNVLSLIEGKEAEKEIEVGPAAIHLTLGLVSALLPVSLDKLLIQSSRGRRRTSSLGIPSKQVANQ